MRLLVLICMIALFLPACREEIQPSRGSVTPGTSHEIPAFEWRIVDREQMLEAYQRAGAAVPDGSKLEGFVAANKETGKLIVYTPPPVGVDGNVTTTLGHEVMHMALGDYHRNR